MSVKYNYGVQPTAQCYVLSPYSEPQIPLFSHLPFACSLFLLTVLHEANLI
jgi:hypothetical protein